MDEGNNIPISVASNADKEADSVEAKLLAGRQFHCVIVFNISH